MTIKSQALVDFIVEWMKTQSLPVIPVLEHWVLYIDGSLILLGAGARVILISPKGECCKYVLQLHFLASNNVTEYEALLHGLHTATLLRIQCLLAHGDSELVVRHVMKDWSCKDLVMEAYCQELC